MRVNAAKRRRHGYYRSASQASVLSTFQCVGIATATAAVMSLVFSWVNGQSAVPFPSSDVLGLSIVPLMTLTVVFAMVSGYRWRKPRSRKVATVATASMAGLGFCLGWGLRVRAWPEGAAFPYADPSQYQQWAIFVAEGALLAAIVLAFAQTAFRNPACRLCGEWCEREDGVAYAAVNDVAAARRRLAQRDLVWFANAADDPDRAYEIRFDLAQCGCEKTTALTVSVARTARPDLVLARDVMLSPADVRTVRAIGRD